MTTRLIGNHPNPVSSVTCIEYEIATGSAVRLEVFSVTGQRVLVLVDRYHAPGSYEHAFSASGLASGVYYYRLTTDDVVDTGRMLIVR